jgi:hypothetical protein
MSLWDNRKASAIEKEKASQRLDCFLSVVYLFPNCLDLNDMELLKRREDELSMIYKMSGRGFFFAYGLGFLGYHAFRRGQTPYFKDVVKHLILCVGGTFVFARMAEKIAAEMYYNRVLINLSDKYNFTPEEVMDLQRNLN